MSVAGTPLPPLPTPEPPPLRLELRSRRAWPGALASLVAHGSLIAVLLIQGRTVPKRGAVPGGGGSGDNRPVVNFFPLPSSAAPAAVEVPEAPRFGVTAVPSLERIRLDLPPIELPRPDLTAGAGLQSVAAAAVGGGQGGGPGTGAGPGVGAAAGPGTSDEAGYICDAAPRTAVLPPLAKVPGSVSGRTYRVRFWVAADGRVRRVEVDPPIADEAYSREFQRRMLAYQFYPARTRDARDAACVVTVPLRIGN
jgi:hypothetical protein